MEVPQREMHRQVAEQATCADMQQLRQARPKEEHEKAVKEHEEEKGKKKEDRQATRRGPTPKGVVEA